MIYINPSEIIEQEGMSHYIREPELFVDGIKILKNEAEIEETFNNSMGDCVHTVDLYNRDLFQKFIGGDWAGIPHAVHTLVLHDYFSDTNLLSAEGYSVESGTVNFTGTVGGMGQIQIILTLDPSFWKGDWSISDYLEAFGEIVSESEYYTLGSRYERFQIIVRRRFNKSDILPFEALRLMSEDIRKIHGSTVRALKDFTLENTVSLRFGFPEVVKVPCGQYLLYFAQFLKDAGVDATADLKHEASEVLFTVTPSDPNEALDKIRQALAVYLSVPANPGIILTPDYNQPLEVQRFVGEIQHLQSQLTYANLALRTQEIAMRAQEAIIEAKNETIDTLHIAVRRQPIQEITATVFVDSVREVVGEAKRDDCETILGGAVEITKYKGDGFNVNTAQIFRWAKGLFAHKPK